MAPKYILVSLPLGIFDSSDKDDALSSLSATVSPENGSTLPFSVPDFKIGTLDALVQQADDLAKLETACQAVVGKVADSLRSILDGDGDKINQQKMVNDSMWATQDGHNSSMLTGLLPRTHRSLSQLFRLE